MSDAQRQTKYCKLSKEQKLLIIQTRLALEADFRKFNNIIKQKSKLWKRIQQQLKEKNSSMNDLTIREMQYTYERHHVLYKKMKETDAINGTWDREIYEMFEKAFADDQPVSSNSKSALRSEMHQVVLNARLSRETEFKNADTNQRTLLWQNILEEVNTKAVGYSEYLNSHRIQHIFYYMLGIYKKSKRNKNMYCWPYFDQMDKIYGNDAVKLKSKKRSHESSKLRQIVLNARLSREAEFKKYSTKNSFERKKLWQEITCEVKEKAAADYCTVELDSFKIQGLFYTMISAYKKCKSNGNRSWKYFEQMDRVYGNCEPFEIFTVNGDNEDVQCNDDDITVTEPTLSAVAMTPATAKKMKFLKEKAFSDRKIFQQICDIEKNKLQLQRAEIDELRKLIIILKAKQKS